MEKIKSFLKERTGTTINEIRGTLDEQVPTALVKEFFFALGGIPLICFALQIITGLFLMCYYVPFSLGLEKGMPSVAYTSVEIITKHSLVMPYIRGVHQISANIMIVSLFLHMIRVFFTESYRRPREFTWVSGMLMFFITMGIGFTGYSLVYDQLSYWAMQVGTNIAGATPIIGGFVRELLLGGVEINPYTITRFYTLHIMVLPGIILMLLLSHCLLVRKQGMSYTGNEDDKTLNAKGIKRYYSLVPGHIFNEFKILGVLVVGFVSFVYLFPPTVSEPANPLITPEHIKPEWYFFPSYNFLKWVSLQVGILTMAFVGTMMIFWPFVRTAMETVLSFGLSRVISMSLGGCFMLFCIVLTILEATH